MVWRGLDGGYLDLQSGAYYGDYPSIGSSPDIFDQTLQRFDQRLGIHRIAIEHEEQIELFFLPSYSPELNPDEYLNCDLKAGVHSGVPARSKNQLAKKAISHLRMIQKKPKRVKKYFKHPKIAYAA